MFDWRHFDSLYDEKPSRRADLGREVLSLEDLCERYKLKTEAPEKYTRRLRRYADSKCSRFSPLNTLTSLIPILSWLPKYNWKTDLLNDIVAGLTVAIMHIPQGMAYALLAGVDPVTGIYTAFFPVLVYVFLGTMPHVSMGTFAVVSIMISKPINHYSMDHLEGHHPTTPSPTTEPWTTIPPSSGEAEADIEYTAMQVAAAVTFCVGIIQLVSGVCRLGFVSVVLTDTLVSAFTVAASLHVIVSQFKHMLGISITKHSGPGSLLYTIMEIGVNIKCTNLTTLGISLSILFVCVLTDKLIAPLIKKKCRFPLPTQLVLIIILTTLSQVYEFRRKFKVRTIDDMGIIPTGIPSPVFPAKELIPKVFVASIAPAVVSFAVGLGLGKMFGKKHGYEVQSSQELLAQGVSNLFGSLFNCLPMSGSLSRSVVQEGSGCKTMLTSLTSATLLLSVMLYLGPLFQPLPISVLSAIILSSLFEIVKKICDVGMFWQLSRFEGFIWSITFISTVFLDIDYGLLMGVLATLAVTMWQATAPRVTVLEKCSGVWLDNKSFHADPGGIKVIVINGPLHFLVYEGIRSRIKNELRSGSEGKYRVEACDIILDISGVSHLDRRGSDLVRWLEDLLANQGFSLGVVATPQQSSLLDLECQVYPTYTDALLLLGSSLSRVTKEIV